MKYIALEKQCAKEIAEQRDNFSGRLKGILSSYRDVVPRYGKSDEYTNLISGCLFDILLEDNEKGQVTFKLKDGWYTPIIPIVLALPLQGEQVELIGNNTVKFDIECSNELWKIIVENYRKRTIFRIKEELGIDVTDVLREETTIINYTGVNDSIYNVDDKTFEEITGSRVEDVLYFLHHVTIPKEHRHLLNEMYDKRSYLFNSKAMDSREIELINLTENDNEIILKLGRLFGGTEEIPLTKTEGQ